MVRKNLEYMVLGTDPEQHAKTYVVLSIFTNDGRSYNHTRWCVENRDSLLGYIVGALYGGVDWEDCKDTDVISNGFTQDIRERFGGLSKEKRINKLNEREFEQIMGFLEKEVCVSSGGRSFLEEREKECWLCYGRGYLIS